MKKTFLFQVLTVTEFNPASGHTEVSTLHFATTEEREVWLRRWFESTAFRALETSKIKEAVEVLDNCNRWDNEEVEIRYSTKFADVRHEDIVDSVEEYDDGKKICERRAPKAKWFFFDCDNKIVDVLLS